MTILTVVPSSDTAKKIAAANDAAWPFVQPTPAVLRASPKKVFAHYFVPFPISIDDRTPSSDYYTNGYLAPDGEGGRHTASGGYIKQRPLPRATVGTNYQQVDMVEDCRRASQLGLDGFTMDILGGVTSPNWSKQIALMQAADSMSAAFGIVLMPDMMSDLATVEGSLVQAIQALAAYDSAYRLDDGRLVLAPYNAQVKPVDWWVQQIAALEAAGLPIAFFPVFQGWQNYAAAFAPISYGLSDWGSRTPGANKLSAASPPKAHAYGTLWMAPVAPQDFRPKSLVYTEAGASANFRLSWEGAISGGADWVQLITWNDYSEATEVSPSTGTQWSFYDLAAYYVTWFKTGTQPAVTKDVLHYFHRKQTAGAVRDTVKQPAAYNLQAGSDAPADTIDLVAFLTAPGTLEITSGGVVAIQVAQAGMNVFSALLRPGAPPKFRLLRNNVEVVTLTSTYPVASGVTYQDFLYRAGCSTRMVVAPT